ncbi:MAG: MarC family protein [Lentisphaeria bacterium]|nr:MarC family protein [Lentisphaeria bacterium]
MNISSFIGLIVKLFLLLTPFFILSIFIVTTEDMEKRKRKNLALRVASAVTVISLVIFLFGELIFRYLGITLNAFRIGCGLVLMLSGIDLVRDSGIPKARDLDTGDDPAVVPLALPCTVGPGTIGTLLVLGTEVSSGSERIFDCVAIVIACLGVGLMLYFSNGVANALKSRGVKILSKLTGMYLVALAAQIMADGVIGFLK